MVKVGFMYDGETEEVILKSKLFDDLLDTIKIKRVGPVKYNHKKVDFYTKYLIGKGAQKIIVLTDQEQSPCVSQVVERVKGHGLNEMHKVVVVKRMIESWELADTQTLKKILGLGNDAPFNSNSNPETDTNPFSTINELIILHSNRNSRKKKHGKRITKVALAHQFVHNGFTIEKSANHPNCSSANYFINSLKGIVKEFNE